MPLVADAVRAALHAGRRPLRRALGHRRDAGVLQPQRPAVLVRVPVPSAAPSALPGVFYVWVNCFGIIAPVQAWSFANSLFDTRQAKRLFGLIGAGAVARRDHRRAAGARARRTGRRHGQPAAGARGADLRRAAVIVLIAERCASGGRADARRGPRRRARPFSRRLRQIAASPYLRLIAGIVFLVAIATQWTSFQLSLVAERHFGRTRTASRGSSAPSTSSLGRRQLPACSCWSRPARCGSFGVVGRHPRCCRWRSASGSSLHPAGRRCSGPCCSPTASIRACASRSTRRPTSCCTCRSPPAQRAAVKNAIDIVVNRVADAVGAVLLGLATQGFFMLPGLALGPARHGGGQPGDHRRSGWRWRGALRSEYVRTIHDSIHRHRLDTERGRRRRSNAPRPTSWRAKLAAADSGRGPLRARSDRRTADAQAGSRPCARCCTHPEPTSAAGRSRSLSAARRRRDRRARAGDAARSGPRRPHRGAALSVARARHRPAARRSRSSAISRTFRSAPAWRRSSPRPGPRRISTRPGVILEGDGAQSRGRTGRRDRAEAARVIGSMPDGVRRSRCRRCIADESLEVARAGRSRAAHRWRARSSTPVADRRRSAAPELADEAADGAGALRQRRSCRDLRRRCATSDVPVEVRARAAVGAAAHRHRGSRAGAGRQPARRPTPPSATASSRRSTSCAPCIPTSASIRGASSCCSRRRSPATTGRIRCSGRCGAAARTTMR